jgi:hypothetical protein
MADNSEININYKKSDQKHSLKTTLNNLLNFEKNQNRLDSVIVTECAKKCFEDFKSDNLNSKESLCMSTCSNKFNDVVMFSEKFLTLMKDNNQDANLNKGDYSAFVNSLKSKFNI